jgi:hypothetical protein
MSEVLDFRREPVFLREPFDAIAPHGSEYLVKGLLPAHGFGFLAGPSGAFKSFLALDWSMRLGSGSSILGRRTRSCAVVYVAAEAPNGVRKRVAAWRRTHSAERLPFELIAQAPDLRDRKQMGDLAAELRIAAGEMAEGEHRLGLVVIDTLAASMPGGDENAGVDMSAVLANVAALSSALGIFVLIVSHTGKDETRGLRGWSGQFAGADCVIMLTREEDAPCAFGRIAKLKDGEAGQRFALSLERVVLDQDGDGDEVSSAVVVYEDGAEPPAKARKQRTLSAAERVLFDAVIYVTDHGDTQSVPATVEGARSGTKAVSWADVRGRAIASGFSDPDIKPDTLKHQLSRARQGIVAAGKVRAEGELLWLL